jgi:hypothetical protein
MRRFIVTEHLLQEHTEQDHTIMRRLAIVVGGFMICTAIMAVVIGAIMG